MSSSNIDSSFEDDEVDQGSVSDDDNLKAELDDSGDFCFGELEIDPLDAEHDQFDCIGLQMDSKTVEEDNNWEVPAESIIWRHEITYQPIVDDPYKPNLPLHNKFSKNLILVIIIICLLLIVLFFFR